MLAKASSSDARKRSGNSGERSRKKPAAFRDIRVSFGRDE
jgi:hypothetical protein